MSVTIRVMPSHGAEVEVSVPIYSLETLGGEGDNGIAEALDEAVARVRAAYGIGA